MNYRIKEKIIDRIRFAMFILLFCCPMAALVIALTEKTS